MRPVFNNLLVDLLFIDFENHTANGLSLFVPVIMLSLPGKINRFSTVIIFVFMILL